MYRIKIFLIPIVLYFPLLSWTQTSIMSVNIRYNNPQDMENSWENRKEEFVGMILRYNPDIFGIQEGLYEQVVYLSENLPDYDYIGSGRDDGKYKGEFSAIFYKKDSFQNLYEKTFWLSETPDQVSVGWDAAMVRISTFGAFRNTKTRDTLYIFNSHFDHIGKEARKNSSELLLNTLKDMKLENKKCIVMGDFNSEPHEAPIKTLNLQLEDAFLSSETPFTGPFGTFNEFNVSKIPVRRIDYIFTKNLQVKSCRHIDDRRKNNLYLSDHLPVFVELHVK